MGPVQVLLLVDHLGRGGAAQVVINTATALDREKFSPIVCTTRKVSLSGQDELLKQAGVTLIELDRQSRLHFLAWTKLWKVLPNVSILHTHESGSNFWGRLWGKLFRVPIIITQDHTAADEKRWIVHQFDRILSRLSDSIITVSQFDRDLSIKFEKLPPHKVKTIYNGIDLTRFDGRLEKREARRRIGLPEDKHLLATIARLVPQKNHQGLLKSLTLLPESIRSTTHCLFIGTGDLENQLRNDVYNLGLQENVSFLGERTDIPIILRAIDLLVLPSHWECLPMTILEALAAKCPVVATAVGGVPEILQRVGWPLVSPNDSSGLSEAIVSVLQMSEVERDKITEFGRQVVVENFSKEASVAEIERLYHLHLTSKMDQKQQ